MMESYCTQLPRVISGRSVERVLKLALVLLENHLTDVGLSEIEKDQREACINDLQALINAGFKDDRIR